MHFKVAKMSVETDVDQMMSTLNKLAIHHSRCVSDSPSMFILFVLVTENFSFTEVLLYRTVCETKHPVQGYLKWEINRNPRMTILESQTVLILNHFISKN